MIRIHLPYVDSRTVDTGCHTHSVVAGHGHHPWRHHGLSFSARLPTTRHQLWARLHNFFGKMSPTNRFFIHKLGFVDHVCHQEIGILINKTGIYLATCCDLSKKLLGVDQGKLGAKQQNWRWKANKAGAVANEIWSGSNKNGVFSWKKNDEQTM